MVIEASCFLFQYTLLSFAWGVRLMHAIAKGAAKIGCSLW
jgi:hypothetical protein